MVELHPKVADALRSIQGQTTVWRHSDFPAPIRSPRDFARAMGYLPARVAKTVLLANAGKPAATRQTIPTASYSAVCLSAPNRIDLKEIADVMRWPRAEMATPTELATILDYPPQGVSPLGIEPVHLLLDSGLFAFETILVGSGRIAIEIELAPEALRAVTSAASVGVFAQ